MVIGVRWVHQDSRDGQQLMGEECGGGTCSETGLSWPVKVKAGHRDGSQG